MAKFTKLNNEQLALIAKAARELDEHDRITKEKEKAEGKRSDIDDLPPGHPLRIMQEKAKQAYEDKLAKEEDLNKQLENMKKRKARRIDEVKQNQAEREVLEKKHKKAKHEIEGALGNFLMQIESFGKVVEGNEKDLIGVGRMKTMKLKGMLVSFCHALNSFKV
jgi:DUF438 domain-containing protein